MDIRSGLDGLKTLLGVTPSAPATTERVAGGQTAGASGLGADSATLSSAGSEVSLTAAEGGVRADKVTAVRSALEAGNYDVPSSAVAAKVIDNMLGQ